MTILRRAAEEGDDALCGARARGEASDVGAVQVRRKRIEIDQPRILAGAEVVLIDRPQRAAARGAVDDRVVHVAELRLDIELQRREPRRAPVLRVECERNDRAVGRDDVEVRCVSAPGVLMRGGWCAEGDARLVGPRRPIGDAPDPRAEDRIVERETGGAEPNK